MTEEEIQTQIELRERSKQIEDSLPTFSAEAVKEAVPDDSKIRLPVFNPESIGPDNSIIFYGKRRTGKSHLIRYLLSIVGGQYCFIWVFSKTAFSGFYQNILGEGGSGFVYQDFDPTVLEQVLNRGSYKKYCDECGAPESHLVILDDIINDKFWFSDTVKRLFTFGRHYNIAVWLTTQHPTAVHPSARGNADLVFVFRLWNRKHFQLIKNEYVQPRGGQVSRLIWTVTATHPNNALVINLQSPVINRPVDYMAWIRAPPDEPVVAPRPCDTSKKYIRWEQKKRQFNRIRNAVGL